ncbi:MAG: ribonuclease III [Candidatus Lustribacter sp.]|jgi:ribonuclease-3
MSTQRRRRIAALLKLSGAPEVDVSAVECAFVHESASSEGAGPSNERLEFFGDAILGFLTSRWLWQHYPAAGEGELSRRRASIVSGEACAQSARRLDLGEIVRLGVGMQHAGGAANTSVLADAFEAYLGALYLATDVERVARFLETHHFAHADHPEAGAGDAKTALQEFAHARFAAAPIYFERAEGPPHDRRFTSQVRIADEIVGEGIGASKKAAQQSAAAMALAYLRNRHPEPEPPESPPPSPPPSSSPSSTEGRVIALRPSRHRPSPQTKAP